MELRKKEVILECLEGKEGIYVKSRGAEVERIAFWLRFIHDHFIPCKSCQKQIKNAFEHNPWRIAKGTMNITMQGDMAGGFEFIIPFIDYTFEPCEHCQKRLREIIRRTSEFTIGNKDYYPPIELWRKYDIDDDSWEEIERRPSTEEEKERLKNQWYD